MERDTRPSVLYLRMSPELRTAVDQRARAAGLSANAFAVQVLAATVGAGVHFQPLPIIDANTGEPLDPIGPRAAELRGLKRDDMGWPCGGIERRRHRIARIRYIEWHLERESAADVGPRTRHIDSNEPWLYREWHEARKREGVYPNDI